MGLSQVEAEVLLISKAKETDNYPITHRNILYIKELSVQNVSTAEVKKFAQMR